MAMLNNQMVIVNVQDGWDDDGNALPNVPIRFHAALSTETVVLVSSCVRLRIS